VIAIAFVTTGVTLGTHAAFGVLLLALVDALGWGRSVAAGAISLILVWCAAPRRGRLTTPTIVRTESRIGTSVW
jgi:hypothetical protein